MIDVLNPVLVKEVRQALRARTFRISLVLTLIAATLATTLLVLSQDPAAAREDGVEYLTAIYACLAIGLIALVPFSAFQSMGAEWEESTFDLLVLSDLKPRRIVIGKWLSALVLGLLFLSAFAPFLTFAYLLRGVDLVALSVLVGGTALASGVLSAASIALSSSNPVRFARWLLVVALAAGLISLVPAATGIAHELMTDAGVLGDPDLQMVLFWLAVACVLTVAMSLALACARLAHPEENRSSGPRVIGTLSLGTGLLAAAQFFERTGERSVVLAMGILLLLPLFAGGARLCVEPLSLGRRVRKLIPKYGSALLVPWLPGGGRGFLYVLLHAAAVIWALSLLLRSPPFEPSERGPGAEQVLWTLVTIALYGVVYLGVPQLFFGRRLSEPRVRRAALIAIPAFALGAAIAPSLVGFLVDDRSLQSGQHLGFPGYLLGRLMEDGTEPSTEFREGVRWLIGAAALVLALHLPRLFSSCAEVARAARERRGA